MDQVTGVDPGVVDHTVAFLRAAHLAELRHSVRDGVNVARFAMKLLARSEAADAATAVKAAIQLALGPDEAEPFVPRPHCAAVRSW